MSTADAVAMTVRAAKKLSKLHQLTLAALRQWHQSLTDAAQRLERYGASGEMKRAKMLKLRFKEMIEVRVEQEALIVIPAAIPVDGFVPLRYAAE